MTGALFAGVDAGSTTVKAVLVDASGAVRGSAIAPGGPLPRETAERVIDEALAVAGGVRGDIACLVSTGYAREAIAGRSRSVTEISCHARGARALVPGARGLIDIGGQDSKAVALDANGGVDRFEMNDKCAAGTGRFLEVMARTLHVPLGESGAVALSSASPAAISSTCTVFAESEVISLVARGAPVADILAGVCRIVAARAAALATRARVAAPVAMTGGVARNAAVVRFLGEALGAPLTVPETPELTGALGAALAARDTAAKQAAQGAPAKETT